MLLRRAHNLVCYWRDGAFVIQNYLGGSEVSLAPMAADLLAAFTDWTTVDEAVTMFPDHDPDSCRAALAELHAYGFLVSEDERERDDRLAEHWETWSPEAGALHFSSKDAPYTESPEVNEDFRAGKRPALFKNYPAADRILLPRAPSTSTPVSSAPSTRAAPTGPSAGRSCRSRCCPDSSRWCSAPASSSTARTSAPS